MNSLIIAFQEEMLQQEIEWHNIETSYLVERTNQILKEAYLLDEEEIIDVEPEDIKDVGPRKTAPTDNKTAGTKIKETAKAIFNAIVNALKSIGDFFSGMFEKLKNKINQWKNRKSSAPTSCTALAVVVPDTTAISKAVNSGTVFEEVPVKKVNVTNPQSFISSCLAGINSLFQAAKNLFSKSKTEGEQGKSAAKKAEGGDSKALTIASEKKKKVSLFGRIISAIFRGISKFFSAMANVYSKKAGKETDKMLKSTSKEELDKHNDKKVKATTKEAELNKKAQKYADKAAKKESFELDSEEIVSNPFLLETKLFREEEILSEDETLNEDEDFTSIDEELEDLENFLENYEEE